MVVNVVVVGPFEEGEEGTGVASDIVKVEGEDPASPGDYPRSVDTRIPQDRNDSPTSGLKNNAQHTGRQSRQVTARRLTTERSYWADRRSG